MKKTALTNLLLLLAIKSVSACSYAAGYGPPVSVFEGREFYFWAIFIGSFVLFVPIVILYFFRNRRGLWTIIASISSLGLFFPAIFMAAFLSICTDGKPLAAVIIAEFFFMSLMFTIQLSSWISQRKTAVKLR
jgi:predicted small secreted protein